MHFKWHVRSDSSLSGWWVCVFVHRLGWAGSTRWNSNLDMMEWQLHKKSALVSLVASSDAKSVMTDEVARLLVDAKFWRDVAVTVKLVKPISRGTDVMQSEDSISVVYHTFSQWETLYDEMKEPGLKEERDLILESVAARWNLISDFCHAAAFMLDPRFRARDMDIAQINDGETYMKGALCGPPRITAKQCLPGRLISDIT